MGKIIKKGVVERVKGKLYYIDGKGNVCEADMKKKVGKTKTVSKKEKTVSDSKSKQKIKLLTIKNITSLIGKKIKWSAGGYKGQNSDGVAIIKSVDLSKKQPLVCQNIKMVSACKLDYAFHEYHGKSFGDKELSYGDGGRFISFEVIK